MLLCSHWSFKDDRTPSKPQTVSRTLLLGPRRIRRTEINAAVTRRQHVTTDKSCCLWDAPSIPSIVIQRNQLGCIFGLLNSIRWPKDGQVHVLYFKNTCSINSTPEDTDGSVCLAGTRCKDLDSVRTRQLVLPPTELHAQSCLGYKQKIFNTRRRNGHTRNTPCTRTNGEAIETIYCGGP